MRLGLTNGGTRCQVPVSLSAADRRTLGSTAGECKRVSATAPSDQSEIICSLNRQQWLVVMRSCFGSSSDHLFCSFVLLKYFLFNPYICVSEAVRHVGLDTQLLHMCCCVVLGRTLSLWLTCHQQLMVNCWQSEASRTSFRLHHAQRIMENYPYDSFELPLLIFL